MKWIPVIIMMFSLNSYAHEAHHHHEMKSSETLPGTSVLQLDSIWKNQKGKSVKLTELSGKPSLAVMLFTQCETACPIIVEDIKSVVKSLSSAEQKKLEVSIFSIDPVRDTPEALRAFAKKRKLPAGWRLFSSNESAIAELAAALGVRYKLLENGDYIHSNVIFLLDSRGVVAAKKEGLKTPSKAFIKQIKKEL